MRGEHLQPRGSRADLHLQQWGDRSKWAPGSRLQPSKTVARRSTRGDGEPASDRPDSSVLIGRPFVKPDNSVSSSCGSSSCGSVSRLAPLAFSSDAYHVPVGDDDVDSDIVGRRGHVLDHLLGKADRDESGSCREPPEEPVIISASVAKTGAVAVEGKSREDHGIDRARFEVPAEPGLARAVARRLELLAAAVSCDPHLACLQVGEEHLDTVCLQLREELGGRDFGAEGSEGKHSACGADLGEGEHR